MTKKHFNRFAAVMAQHKDTDPVKQVSIEVFMEVCAASNPRFDRKRFQDACKYKEKEEETHANNN